MNDNEKASAVTPAEDKRLTQIIPYGPTFTQVDTEDAYVRTQRTPTDESYLKAKGEI